MEPHGLLRLGKTFIEHIHHTLAVFHDRVLLIASSTVLLVLLSQYSHPFLVLDICPSIHKTHDIRRSRLSSPCSHRLFHTSKNARDCTSLPLARRSKLSQEAGTLPRSLHNFVVGPGHVRHETEHVLDDRLQPSGHKNTIKFRVYV